MGIETLRQIIFTRFMISFMYILFPGLSHAKRSTMKSKSRKWKSLRLQVHCFLKSMPCGESKLYGATSRSASTTP